MKKLLHKNQSGMSLISVTIAIGLVGGLSLVLMRLMDNTRKQTKYAEVKTNELQTISQISTYLANPSICSIAFSGFRAGDNFGLLQFNTKGEGSRLEEGVPIGNTGLITESLSIMPDPVYMTGTDGIYEMTFRVRTKRKDGDYNMAGTSKNKDFKFLAQLCEPWAIKYKDERGYAMARNNCENEKIGNPDVDSVYQMPEDDNYPSAGIFTCYVCGKDKIISKCDKG